MIFQNYLFQLRKIGGVDYGGYRTKMVNQDFDKKLRLHLQSSLESGLKTMVEPRAYDGEAILEIVQQLQQVNTLDYDSKLVIAGFTLSIYGDIEDEQVCETCMYYKTHRQFCELPELMFPVKPEWSCRLWRI